MLDLLAVSVLGFFLLALPYGFYRLLSGPDRDALERAQLATLGITGSAVELNGELAGRTVELRVRRTHSGKRVITHRHTSIWVRELPSGFLVEPTRGDLDGLLGLDRGDEPDTTIGDPAFDRRFRVQVPGLSLGLLDATVRARIWGSTSINRGYFGNITIDTPWEASVLRAQADLAQYLVSRAQDLRSSLSNMVTGDPLPAVRLNALAALVADDLERTRSLLDAAVAGAEPATRAAALLHLGRTEGLAEALRAVPERERHTLITTSVAPGTPAQVAIAVATLGAQLQPRPVWFVLTAAAAARPGPEVRRAVLGALPHQATGGDATFASDRAAVALCGDRAPEVEEGLLSLLATLDRAVEEVASWLAERGTVAAVPAIDRAVDRLGSSPRAHLLQARTLIQARARGERGGLALADPAAGAAHELGPDLRGRLASPQ